MKKKNKNSRLLLDLKKIALVMKLCFFILLISGASVMASSGYSQSTKLSMDLQKVSLGELIEQIEQSTEFIFVFYDDIVDLNHKVTVKAEDATVDKILEQAFQSTDNTFAIFDRQIVITNKVKEAAATQTTLVDAEAEQPQRKEVSGTIKDQGGMPLPGVSVLVKGTTIGTVTDGLGKFSLSIPVDAKTLMFSFVGMKTMEVAVGTQTTFNVVLEEETIGIDEVVCCLRYGQKERPDRFYRHHR
jgi:hypothetical protein